MRKTPQQPPVLFRANWYDAIEKMPAEYHSAVYKAIMRYAFMGEVPSDPMVMGLASMIFQLIDGDRQRYQQVSDSRSQSAKKRWSKAEAEACNCIQADASDANTNTNTITNTNTNTNTNDYVNKDGVDGGVSAQEVLDSLLTPDNRERVSALARQLRVSVETLHVLAREVVNDWELTRQRHATLEDGLRHFVFTLRKKRGASASAVNHKVLSVNDEAARTAPPLLSDKQRAALERLKEARQRMAKDKAV